MSGVVVALMLIAIIGGIVAALAQARRPPMGGYEVLPDSMPSFAPSGTVDVTALRFGIDGRASKFVRTELEAIAKTYAATDAETRARKLREVSIMLRRVRDSWMYGGADNEPMRSRDEALAAFARHLQAARTAPATSAVVAPTGMPVSLILVTVVVAARGELMTVTPSATGEDLRRALESAMHRAGDEILALEVAWVPAGDGQVSSTELESVYKPAQLHPLEGVTAGKVFCTYCHAPFPGELVTCPRCGGPAPGRERHA